MSTTPAGWYQDPSGTHHLRYWDGSAWTHYASTGGQQVVSPISSDIAPPSVWSPDNPTEPVGAVSATSTLAGPPLAPLPMTETATNEVVHRRRKWPFLLAGVGVLIGIGVIIAIAAGGDDNKESVATATTTVDKCATAPDPPACREVSGPSALPTTTVVRISFDQSNYSLASSDPDAYKGSDVKIVGKVFGDVTRSGGGIGFQMFADPPHSSQNTVVIFAGTDPGVQPDDYVRVTGTITGAYEGENAFGGKVTAVQIRADQVEKVDATAFASPVIREVTGVGSHTQFGITMTVDKVQFAANETRVFLTVKNSTGNKASFFSFNSKATQGSQQFDAKSFGSDYPEVQSEILPGVQSSGVLVFPPMNASPPTVFNLEARTDNYQVDFQPYRFTVPGA